MVPHSMVLPVLLDVDYTGTDFIRVRDLALIQTSFRLEVEFFQTLVLPVYLLIVSLLILTIATAYYPGKEKEISRFGLETFGIKIFGQIQL